MTTATAVAESVRRRKLDAFPLTGQRGTRRYAPLRTVSDLTKKRWMDGAVPLALAMLLIAVLFFATPVALGDSEPIMNDVAMMGLIAIGLTIVMVGGGIDLSVGSIAGIGAIGSLLLHRAFGVPMLIVVLLVPLGGALLGAVNGFFIAKVKTRPFITTLVTLLAFQGLIKGIQSQYAVELSFPLPDLVWDFLARGSILGLPTIWWVFGTILLVAHLGLTRSRWGWWVTSVGSDRRSARRNGIAVDRIVFSTYVVSGTLAAIAGLIASARFGRADAAVGAGWELIALTAVVLGGVSLRGGRGSVIRASVGIFVVAALQMASVKLALENGYFQTILAVILLAFAILDIKWGKYRDRIGEKLSLDPGRVAVGTLVDVTRPDTIWSVNHHLTDAPPIGLGRIEGAEDCALDSQGNLYCGDRRGWIWRFSGENHERGEVFARTGGLPLGHAWDLEGNLLVCVGGMGLYRIMPDGCTEIVADRVRRNWKSLHDDSAVRFADDVDLTPDGAIYFTDFSTRTNAADYMLELVEYRANGRVIRVDPDGSTEVVIDGYVFPNGLCTSHEGDSILVASTGLFRIDRLWTAGPKQGQFEPVLENLPGYPDNINRASDGNYWMSFVAMRTPVSDLLMKYPSVRRRMTRELPDDDWFVPQLNVSCVMKFNNRGEILKTLWDATLQKYPMVTSIKEYDGDLYLCGVQNNRVGRLPLDPVDIGSIDPRLVPHAPHQTMPYLGVRA
jgi:ribose transport system permease protein